MPILIDEPELHFTRRLFEGAVHKPASLTPQAQFGGWLVLENFLRHFEQEVYWPADNPSPVLVQTYRTFVTSILAMGESLLTAKLDAQERGIVQSSVNVLRDKLVLEFSDVTRSQSENLLEELFGSGAAVG